MTMTTTTMEALEQLNEELAQGAKRGQIETEALKNLQDKTLSDIAALAHKPSTPSLRIPWRWLALGAVIGAGTLMLSLWWF